MSSQKLSQAVFHFSSNDVCQVMQEEMCTERTLAHPNPSLKVLVFPHTLSLKKKKNHQNNNYELDSESFWNLEIPFLVYVHKSSCVRPKAVREMGAIRGHAN